VNLFFIFYFLFFITIFFGVLDLTFTFDFEVDRGLEIDFIDLVEEEELDDFIDLVEEEDLTDFREFEEEEICFGGGGAICFFSNSRLSCVHLLLSTAKTDFRATFFNECK